MTAAAVTQLQAVVSREIGMTDQAVVTVGALQAGSSANIIPDHALLRLNIRAFDEQARDRVLSAVRRIIAKQAELSRSPRSPAFKTLSALPRAFGNQDAQAVHGGTHTHGAGFALIRPALERLAGTPETERGQDRPSPIARAVNGSGWQARRSARPRRSR